MSTKILIIGAGKSTTFLIAYLQKKAVENDWYIILADANEALAMSKWNNAKNGHAIGFDILDNKVRSENIKAVDTVISMLPAYLHLRVAEDCLAHSKSLFTASYIDDQLKKLDTKIQDKNVLFLCEMGLDPGIDHMSAMELIHRIQNKGGKITDFASHCGGLIAPESDTNPWHYKISWNPRNIILAGKEGAKFVVSGKTKSVAYEQLFLNTPRVQIPRLGLLSYYPNRESHNYIETYDLKGIPNFVRTTLRHPDFCSGWNAIIQLGLTDENIFTRKSNDSIQSWFNAHLESTKKRSIYEHMLKDEILKNQLLFLDFDASTLIPIELNTNAAILQWIVESKWRLQPTDKDLVVMQHEIKYTLNGNPHELISSMIVKGEDANHTAMAKTVGYPLAMVVCAYLKGQIQLTGLQIPTHPSIYKPILESLQQEGIFFDEISK